MKQRLSRRVWPFAALALLSAVLGLSGCFNPFSPRIAAGPGFSKQAPAPSSASNLLRLFEWCYNQKAIAEYRELFTDDYRFYFSPLDSTGVEYKGTPWTREDELISTTHLFVGGSADQPPASTVHLTLDKNFRIYPDANFARSDPTGRGHKNIRTQIVLTIRTEEGATDISGAANFYLVRGDSAVIPEELRSQGFGPDPNRWYIRRLDDETAQAEPGAFAALPAGGASRTGSVVPDPTGARATTSPAFDAASQVASWGYIKAYYRRFGGSVTSRAAARPTAR